MKALIMPVFSAVYVWIRFLIYGYHDVEDYEEGCSL
jgi:hypothetical protein